MHVEWCAALQWILIGTLERKIHSCSQQNGTNSLFACGRWGEMRMGSLVWFENKTTLRR